MPKRPTQQTHKRIVQVRIAMRRQSRTSRSPLLPIVLLICLQCCAALHCRTDDGPSEAELKRITRSCMRKIGENSGGMSASSGSTSGSASSSSSSNHFGYGTYNNNNNNNNYHGSQQQQQQPQTRYGHGGQYGSASYNYDDDSDDDNNNNNNNNNQNYNNNNYNFGNYGRGEPDMLHRRNRDRQQSTNRSGLSGQGPERAYNVAPNNERTRYDYGNNGGSGGGGSGSNGGGSGNGNGNGGNSGGGHGNNRNSNSGSNNSGNNNNNNNNSGKNNSNNNNNNNNNNSTYDAACVVHCFFEEMNMLNADDYPDRYKVQYLLTRELRDRELRHFYTDTIQQCFQYLESQRRRDKCHYSRELINCMSEYAKANCDDWQEYSVMFN